MVKLKKLFGILGFYSLLLIGFLIFLVILEYSVLVTNDNFKLIGIILLYGGIIIPNVSLGFAISGLIKDKSKRLAIIGFIMSVLIILFLIFYYYSYLLGG